MATFLSTAQIDTLFTNQMRNLGGVNENTRLMWYNWFNQFVYPKLTSINPNDYLQNRTIKTIKDQRGYTLPTDFQDVQQGGVFKAGGGTEFVAINYDAEASTFTVDETLTGASSGATGTIEEVVDYGSTGTLRLSGVDGAFEDNEIISDSATGGATVNGSQIIYSWDFGTDQHLTEQANGNLEGFNVDTENLNMASLPGTSQVFTLRHIPELDEMTGSISTSQFTIIPIRFKQFAYRANKIFLSDYRVRGDLEFLDTQRFQSAINDAMPAIKKTHNVMNLPNRNAIYQQG